MQINQPNSHLSSSLEQVNGGSATSQRSGSLRSASANSNINVGLGQFTGTSWQNTFSLPFLATFISNLRSINEQFSRFSREIEIQQARDRAAGVGIFQGARQAYQAAGVAYQNIQADEYRKGLPQAVNQPSSSEMAFHQLGSAAQTYASTQLKQEALIGIANLTGLDPSSLSVSGLLDQGVEYVASQLGFSLGSAGAEAAGGAAAATAGEASAATGALGQIAGAAGAAYSAYGMIKNWGKMSPSAGAIQGATAGAYVGSFFGPIGTAVGGLIGGAVGAANKFFKKVFGGGKHKDQVARDQVRKFMLQQGMIDKNWTIGLANGDRFDIGKDGKAKLQNTDGTERRYYQIDFTNPLAGQAIALVDPLAAVLCGGNRKLHTDFTGYFTNAITSNTNSPEEMMKNALAIYQQVGFPPDKLLAALQELHQNGSISDRELQVFSQNFINMLNSGFEASSEKIAA